MNKKDLLEIDLYLTKIEYIIDKHAKKYRLDREEDVLIHNVKQYRKNLAEKIRLNLI